LRPRIVKENKRKLSCFNIEGKQKVNPKAAGPKTSSPLKYVTTSSRKRHQVQMETHWEEKKKFRMEKKKQGWDARKKAQILGRRISHGIGVIRLATGKLGKKRRKKKLKKSGRRRDWEKGDTQLKNPFFK